MLFVLAELPYHRDPHEPPPMLSTLTTKANLRRPSWVSAEALNVAPELLGAPLAKPARRALAMGLDLLAIALLSGLDGFWLGAAVVVFLYHMRSQELGKRSWLRNAWLWGICALCLWLAAERGWQSWTERHSPASAVTNQERAVPTDAVAASVAPQPKASSPSAVPTAPALPASGATLASPGEIKLTDAERIEALEEQLSEARKPQDFRWQAALKKWWDDLGVGFGWAIVYFALIPTWLKGQTLGKKLLGLRVVELTGKPLSVRMCFSRYGGYVAGMATGGFGFAQILWDDNRQAIQDKVAHTVVIDLRAPYQEVQPLPEAVPEIAPLTEP